MTFEPVYTMPDWYDGPRGGVASLTVSPTCTCRVGMTSIPPKTTSTCFRRFLRKHFYLHLRPGEFGFDGLLPSNEARRRLTLIPVYPKTAFMSRRPRHLTDRSTRERIEPPNSCARRC